MDTESQLIQELERARLRIKELEMLAFCKIDEYNISHLLYETVKQTEDGFIICDLNGVIQFCNQAFSLLIKHDKEDLIRKNFFQFVRIDDYFEFLTRFKRGDQIGDMQLIDKEQNYHKVFMKNSVLFGDSGDVLAFVGWMTKEVLDPVLTSKYQGDDWLTELSNSECDCFWLLDAGGNFGQISDGIKRLLGYESYEVIGRSPFDLVVSSNVDQIQKHYFDAFLEKQPIKDLECVYKHKEGASIRLLANGTPIIDEEGDLIGFRGTYTGT